MVILQTDYVVVQIVHYNRRFQDVFRSVFSGERAMKGMSFPVSPIAAAATALFSVVALQHLAGYAAIAGMIVLPDALVA